MMHMSKGSDAGILFNRIEHDLYMGKEIEAGILFNRIEHDENGQG